MTARQSQRERGGRGARQAQAAPPVGIAPGLRIKTRQATARALCGYTLFGVNMDRLPSLAAAARADYTIRAGGLRVKVWTQAGGQYGIINLHTPEARVIAAAVGARYERRAAENPGRAAEEFARFVAGLGMLFEFSGGRAPYGVE